MVTPQQHMLTRLVAQRSCGGQQAQPQNPVVQPVVPDHSRRHPFARWVENRNLEVFRHTALASEPPAFQAPGSVECLRAGVLRLPLQAAHQAGMATACSAARGYVEAGIIEHIEQIAALRHPPGPLPVGDLRHSPQPSWSRTDFDHFPWLGTARRRRAARIHPDRRLHEAGSSRPRGSNDQPA